MIIKITTLALTFIRLLCAFLACTSFILVTRIFFRNIEKHKRTKTTEPNRLTVPERNTLNYNGPFKHIYRVCCGPQTSLFQTAKHDNADLEFYFEQESLPTDDINEIPEVPINSLGTVLYSHNQVFGIVGNEPNNLFAAIRCRLTANTPDPTVPNCMVRMCHSLVGQRHGYGFSKDINGIIFSYLKEPMVAKPIKEVLKKYTGLKLKRYLKALEDCRLMDDTYYLGDITKSNYKTLIDRVKTKGNNCFHKREKLWYKEEEGNGVLKPRLIINPAVEVQIWLMQYETGIKKAFAEFTEEPFILQTNSHGSIKVRFDFAANVGTDTASLTAWLKKAHIDLDDGIWTFILMGDDIYGVTLRDGLPYYIELDYSAFDSTQKDDAIIAEHNLYRALGLPEEVIQVSLAQHDAPIYTTKIKKMEGLKMCFQASVKLKHLLRISGGWNTSIGGSVVNMFGLAHVLKTMSPHGYNTFAEVGFKIKESAYLKTHNIMECTFLKCGFTVDHEVILLPSRILKVGSYAKTVKFEEAMTYIKGDVLGWGNIAEDFPILGSFRKKVCEITKHHDAIDICKKHADYRTKQVGVVTRTDVLDMMLIRYDLHEKDVIRIEEKISRIKSFPWHTSDPIFEVLRTRDY